MKQTLYEFDPGYIINGFRYGIAPAVKNGLTSAKSTIGAAKDAAKRNKKSIYSNIIKQLSKASRNDKTMFGDAVRGAELGRQIGSVIALQNAPPLPTPDSQSINQTLQSLRHFLSRGSRAKGASVTMDKALSNPKKSLKDFFVNRATFSTYRDSPFTSYNSALLGLSGPVVDNNSIMMAFQQSGMSIKDFLLHLKNYNVAAYNQAKQMIPQFKNSIMNRVNKLGSIFNGVKLAPNFAS